MKIENVWSIAFTRIPIEHRLLAAIRHDALLIEFDQVSEVANISVGVWTPGSNQDCVTIRTGESIKHYSIRS